MNCQIADRLGKTLLKYLTTDFGGAWSYLAAYNEQISKDVSPCRQAMTEQHNHDFIVEIYEVDSSI